RAGRAPVRHRRRAGGRGRGRPPRRADGEGARAPRPRQRAGADRVEPVGGRRPDEGRDRDRAHTPGDGGAVRARNRARRGRAAHARVRGQPRRAPRRGPRRRARRRRRGAAPGRGRRPDQRLPARPARPADAPRPAPAPGLGGRHQLALAAAAAGGGGVAEPGARLVLGGERRGVEVPDPPDPVAAPVVAAEDARLAEPDGDDVAPPPVEREHRVEQPRPRALVGAHGERQDALGGHVRQVALDRHPHVPELRRLGRDEVLLVVLEEAHLLLERVVRVPVQVPHQVAGREALAHPVDVEPDVRRPPLPVHATDLALVRLRVVHVASSFRSSASTTGSILAAPRTRSSRLTKPAQASRSAARSPPAYPSRASRSRSSRSSSEPTATHSSSGVAPKYSACRPKRRRSSATGAAWSSTRRSTATSEPPYPAPRAATTSAADCCPRRSPPAAWPASSARRRRSASGRPEPPSKAAAIASTVSRETRMFPWTAYPSPVRPPAQARQPSPVKDALPPRASTTPSCRCARPSSAAVRRATASSAEAPPASSASPSRPQPTFSQACVATAPTSACTHGASAPTARNLDWTATPHSRRSRSQATIE